MLYTDFTAKLLKMEDVQIKSLEETMNTIEIHIETNRKEQTCPKCGKKSNIVHDYREQRVKDIPMQGKQLKLVFKKRRYKCAHCNKRFYETLTHVPRYHRMTNRLSAYVIEKLANTNSFTSIAQEVGLSVTTVIRLFDIISYGKPTLPRVIAIDEFKGNANGEKYQCIVTDAENKVVLDI